MQMVVVADIRSAAFTFQGPLVEVFLSLPVSHSTLYKP